MKPIARICYILAMGSCLMIIGCDQKYVFKDYGYRGEAAAYEFVKVSGALFGSEKRLDKYSTIRTFPYELFLSVTLNDFPKNTAPNCTAELESLVVIDINNGSAVFSKSNIREPFKIKSKSEYAAYFSFQGLQLDYVDYRADITFHLQGDCAYGIDGAIQKTALKFTRNYKEEHLSSWDLLVRQ